MINQILTKEQLTAETIVKEAIEKSKAGELIVLLPHSKENEIELEEVCFLKETFYGSNELLFLGPLDPKHDYHLWAIKLK